MHRGKLARNNSVDEGVVAFGQWVCNNDVATLPITLRRFSGGRAVLRDRLLLCDVTVEAAGSVPRCLPCASNDCICVGFAVCYPDGKKRHFGSAVKGTFCFS